MGVQNTCGAPFRTVVRAVRTTVVFAPVRNGLTEKDRSLEKGVLMTGKKLTLILVALLAVALLFGCSKKEQTKPLSDQGEDAKVLTIVWQHSPEKEGAKCENCLAKKEELKIAYESLRTSLPSLGIQVAMKEEKPVATACGVAMTKSCGIFIGGRPLETWLGAQIGKSACGSGKGCGADGSAQCVSMKLGGKTYTVVPADLIVKAGLMAASELIEPQSSKACPKSGTCPKKAVAGN